MAQTTHCRIVVFGTAPRGAGLGMPIPSLGSAEAGMEGVTLATRSQVEVRIGLEGAVRIEEAETAVVVVVAGTEPMAGIVIELANHIKVVEAGIEAFITAIRVGIMAAATLEAKIGSEVGTIANANSFGFDLE